MSIINAFPLNLQNGTIEDASQVMSLFAWVQSQTNGGACPSTSGQIVLKGNGVGGTSPAVPDIDYASPASAVPIGAIIDYGGGTPPGGYLPCDGRALSRTGYSLLFSKIGVIWGAGDGVTTFNIPNTGGRTAVFYGFGLGTGSGAGSGTVSSITIASANGFSGLVATPTTTAIVTLSTTITGVIKGAAGALALALNSDLPAMSATEGGAVPTPPNLTTHYLRGDGTWVDPAFGPIANPTFTGIVTAPQVYITDTTNATSAITGPLRSAGGGSVTKDFWVGQDLHVNKDIYQQYSAPGFVIGSAVSNSDNTNSLSGASVSISTGGPLAGDPLVQYFVDGVTFWSHGIDNSDGDKFKISAFLALGTNDYLVIDPTTGVVTATMGFAVAGGVSTPGTIWKGSSGALQIRGASGINFDLAIRSESNQLIVTNPTGTAHLNVDGSFGRGSPVTKTADFTIDTGENNLLNNKAGSTCVVTLPSATVYLGREILLCNMQAQLVNSATSNVIPLGGTVGGTAILAATIGKWCVLISDGTNWLVMMAG